MRKVLLFLLFCLFFSSKATSAQADLTQMSMEQLMNIQIISAAKKPEPIWDTAAAITVITQDDVRRSGATNIPDLLRMVPGVRVERINAYTWDISIRGFNGSVFANKLLVLIDGRSVYTPIDGGVIWALQDLPLEDIERIEVIRGPGGTMWGANAVNGVVNIITKKAKDTQGGLVSVGGGTQERGSATAQYGSKASDWYYRTYAKYFDMGPGYRSDGNNVDAWDTSRGGFRAENGKLTLQGDFFDLNAQGLATETSFDSPFIETYKDTSRTRGGNLMATYQDDDWSFKTYWDVNDIQGDALGARTDQIDMEYNRLVHLTENQDLNGGLQYHLNLEDMRNTLAETINKTKDVDQRFSLFLQDEIKAMDDRLKFTIGTKLEHNIFTGLEIEPNARVLYHINDQNEVWAAASRSVRTPSLLETNGVITYYSSSLPFLGIPGFERVLGERHVHDETMRAYELGYRNQFNKNVTFDLALFYNTYDKLLGYDLGGAFVTSQNGFSIENFPYTNLMRGEVHGAEISSDIQVKEWWKIKWYYSFTKMDLTTEPGYIDGGLPAALNAVTPVSSTYLRSSFDLPHGFELDATFRYQSTYARGIVPDVTQLDINLGKNIKGWQVNLVAQNLLENHHYETYQNFAPTTQVPRSYYLKLTHKF